MNQREQGNLNARLRARATNAKICEQCGRSYVSGPMAHQCDRNDLMRRQARAVRNMPPVVTCDNCGLTYYQTSAPHVCAGWTTTKPVKETIMSGAGECRDQYDTWMDHLSTTEHEPVARGGEGEWRVHQNKREIVDERGFYVAFVTDEPTAARIVTEHNQHHSLLAERERLREMLRAALKIVADRAAGGRMLTTHREAKEVWDKGVTALDEELSILDVVLNDQEDVETIDQKEGER